MAITHPSTFFALLSLCSLLLHVSSTIAIPTATSFANDEILSHYDYGQIKLNLLKKRQSSDTPFIVTGVQTNLPTDGSVPLRLEIRQLQQNIEQWNLFLLALDRLQYTDQTELLSWYELGAIHGRPYRAWNNVQNTTAAQGNSGYCAHNSILFSTWHRPYLALIEQVVYDTMQQILGYYGNDTQRQELSIAIADFRFPYWDWAAQPADGKSILPDSVGGSPGVEVDGPAGVQNIANPLYNYVFKPFIPSDLPEQPLVNWDATVRYPPNSSGLPTVSQDNLVGAEFDNSASTIRDRLYNLFVNYPDFSKFSNAGWITYGESGNAYDSLESLHDMIHGLSGSGGHMTYIDYSAFDPIFFLHHVMVDRCLAMWQVLYPDSYVVPTAALHDTFTNSQGQIQDENSPLTPFYQTETSFWTSATSRSTEAFGYAYAETANTSSDTYAAVISAINKLYGTTAPANTVSKRAQPLQRALDPPISALVDREIATNSSAGLPADLAPSNQYNEYIVNLRVKKYALAGPFSIYIFLGDPSDDSTQWGLQPNLVGSHCIFAKVVPSTDTMTNMTGEVTGTIPLTSALLNVVASGGLPNLDQDGVISYLKDNLRWRVMLIDKTPVANEAVPDLIVTVVTAVVTRSDSPHAFPVWGPLSVVLDFAGGDVTNDTGE